MARHDLLAFVQQHQADFITNQVFFTLALILYHFHSELLLIRQSFDLKNNAHSPFPYLFIGFVAFARVILLEFYCLSDRFQMIVRIRFCQLSSHIFRSF